MILAPSERSAAGVQQGWNEYTDLGTALLAVARRDLSTVFFDEFLHDRETETRSFRLTRDVRVEGLMHDVAREAGPHVLRRPHTHRAPGTARL